MVKKKLVICSLIAFFFSVMMLFNAPVTYEYEYCKNVLLLSSVISLFFLYFISKQEGVLNFHTIFIFSFFCINYIHAVFIYPDDSLFPSLYRFYYSSSIIPYSLAVAQIGLISYILGATLVYKKNCNLDFPKLRKIRDYSISDKLSLIISILLITYVFFILKVQGFHLYPRLMVLILSVLFVCFFLKCSIINNYDILSLVRQNKLCIISIFLFILSQLYLGSRAEVIFIFFAIVGIINRYYYRISFKYIILFGTLGIIFFAVITFTRISDTNFTTASFFDVIVYGWDVLVSSGNFILISLTDFIVNSRNLYDGIVYSHENGLLYGQSYIQYLFSFIPFGGTTITPLLIGKSIEEVNTGIILTKNIDANFGIGTNAIADIYMNFSLPGVIFMMFLLGLIVQKVKQSSNVYGNFAYYSLLANSLYIPRASIFAWIDMFVFFIIMYFIITFLCNLKLKKC